MDSNHSDTTDTQPQPSAHADSSTQPQPAKKARRTRLKATTARADRSPPSTDPPSRVSHVRDQPQQAPSPRFTAHLQPYPGPNGPAYHVMNPSYPINGGIYPSAPSPFNQPQSSASPANGQGSHVGPPLPGHAPAYAYAVHAHPQYAHHYPSFPQYAPPSGMMMYGAPPPPHPDTTAPSTSASSPVLPSSASGKRKRKSIAGADHNRTSDEEGADSASDVARAGAQASATAVDNKKRTKTQRACDSCRSRKIRCDVLPDSDPAICQHCKQYGFECTFFLPITETRFKKKKLEEEAAAAAAAAAEKEKEAERSTSSPHAESSGEVKVLGPTSPAYLLHSQAMVPSRSYESYDMRYHHSWDISSNGDGIIKILEPQKGELQLALPKPIELRIERDVLEKLVNAYFEDVAPMLPVVTRSEFLENTPPPPLLLYSMCLVAAASRGIPQHVFDSMRYAVNGLIKQEDVLSTASIVNIQSLLILSMVGDSHSQFVPNALSAMWIRLGSAIRMAQDLGLHRAEAVKQNIELRRRLWSICVISDRWISLTFGHPYMIDVQDCDARLPSSADDNDMYMNQLVRLSIILGRVLKTIYTPAGLAATSDEQLERLLQDLELWKASLPETLQYRGPNTPRNAGILFLFYCSVDMLFWRVFMRISYKCPAHLKFSLTVEKWTDLVEMSAQAISWLDNNERLYDVWLLVAYCATACALVQYHTYARRRDPAAQAKLRQLRDCVRRWEASLSPDHMSARRKTAEIISLLYEATQGSDIPVDAPALNPAGGVQGRQAPLNGLVFHKDSSRPGGGVFVAQGPQLEMDRNIPEGTIISGNESRVPESAQRHSATQQQQMAQNSSMVLLTPLPGNGPSNVNPTLNDQTTSGSQNVQVMNALGEAPANLYNLAMADSGYLEGIPTQMFDWSQWDTFFSRFTPGTSNFRINAADVGNAPNSSGPLQSSAQVQQYQQYASAGAPSNTGM